MPANFMLGQGIVLGSGPLANWALVIGLALIAGTVLLRYWRMNS